MLKMIGQNKLITDDGTANSGCNYCTKSTFNESYSLLGKIGYLINEKNFINVAVGLTDLRVKREILYFNSLILLV